MISLYSGTPGSGKSLHIAQRIYYTLRRGRMVVGNFEIDCNRVHRKKAQNGKLRYKYLPNDMLTPQRLIALSREYFGKRRIKEDDILLVIDESQIIFNSREWQKGGRSEWLTFFSQHRKYGYEIVLIAQFDGMIDRQIRSLIEYELKHRKIANFGKVGFLISLIAFGNLFCAVRMWYPLNERLDAQWFVARSRYYRIYDTYAQFPAIEAKNGETKNQASE